MLLSGVAVEPGWGERTSRLNGPSFAVREAPPGIPGYGGGEVSLLGGPGFGDCNVFSPPEGEVGLSGGCNTFSLMGWEAGRDEEGSERFWRRRRPSSLIAELGRFKICSRPVFVGGCGTGAVIAPPVGADGVFCVAIPELATSEALASLIAFSAAS